MSKRLRQESPPRRPDSPNYISDSSASLSETETIWPSSRSKLCFFQELIRNNNFLIGSSVVEVVIKDIPNTENFPLPSCAECEETWKNANILASASTINWPLMTTSTFDVSNVDRRFFQLFSSYRSALTIGCYNGLAKKVMENFVSLVRRETLCPKHDIKLNVYSPSTAKEPGGIVSRIYPVDKKSDDNCCSGSETIVGRPDVAVVLDRTYQFIAVTEHKKSEFVRSRVEVLPTCIDSHIGQLLHYLLGIHLQQLLKEKTHQGIVMPILGVFMDGVAIQSVISDVTQKGNDYRLTIYLGEKIEDLNCGIAHMITILHRFFAVDH